MCGCIFFAFSTSNHNLLFGMQEGERRGTSIACIPHSFRRTDSRSSLQPLLHFSTLRSSSLLFNQQESSLFIPRNYFVYIYPRSRGLPCSARRISNGTIVKCWRLRRLCCLQQDGEEKGAWTSEASC